MLELDSEVSIGGANPSKLARWEWAYGVLDGLLSRGKGPIVLGVGAIEGPGYGSEDTGYRSGNQGR